MSRDHRMAVFAVQQTGGYSGKREYDFQRSCYTWQREVNPSRPAVRAGRLFTVYLALLFYNFFFFLRKSH